jgi:hypothetical protein
VEILDPVIHKGQIALPFITLGEPYTEDVFKSSTTAVHVPLGRKRLKFSIVTNPAITGKYLAKPLADNVLSL